MANNSTVSAMKLTPMAEATEAQLWNDFRKGDRSAFAFIYVKFFPILFSYGHRMCKDGDLVQDCIQDLFVELSTASGRLSETTSIRYYLYRCIRRKIADRLLKIRHQEIQPLDVYDHAAQGNDLILPIEFQQIELETASEKRLEILNALQFLTKKQRKVIQLRFYEDMSCKEISTRMSVNINTVYNLISLATSALRGMVKRVSIILLMSRLLF